MTYKGSEIISRMVLATGVKNQEALARLLKIKSASLSPYKKQETVPSSWLDWLEATEGINPDYLLTGEGSVRKPTWAGPGGAEGHGGKIPLISSRHSKSGGFQQLPSSENWPCFDGPTLSELSPDSTRLLLLKFTGLHMNPEIQESDLILFDQKRISMESGRLYVVRVEEAITVHRLLLGAGTIILRSENREYPDQVVERTLLGSPQFEVLGRILGVFRRYS